MHTGPLPQLDFVFFDAGGGHRAAATALQQVSAEQNLRWNVRLMNLQDVLDPLDFFHRYIGIRAQDIYNQVLARGWTLGSPALVPVMHGIIRFNHAKMVRFVQDYWRKQPPDMVVSLIPNFNRILWQGLQAVNPAALYATILTDMADYPPHFWIERQPQHFLCGTERAMQQALQMGHPASHVHRLSGMILRPEFHLPAMANVPEERCALGLQADLPTGLILFGGQGSPMILRIVQQLQACQHPLQLIVMTGRNERLARRLRALSSRVPLHIVGFTPDVPRYMRLADFFLGKPGPGSISEAITMHLPVIVERNAWTLPQERYNTEWVSEQNIGVVLPSFRDVAVAVDNLLSGNKLREMQTNTQRIRNRAVYEAVDILQTILASRTPTPVSPAKHVSDIYG